MKELTTPGAYEEAERARATRQAEYKAKAQREARRAKQIAQSEVIFQG